MKARLTPSAGYIGRRELILECLSHNDADCAPYVELLFDPLTPTEPELRRAPVGQTDRTSKDKAQ